MDKINYIIEHLDNGKSVSLISSKYSVNNQLLLIKYNKHKYYSDDIHVNFEVLKTDITDFKSYAKSLVKGFDLVKYNSQGDSFIYFYKVQNIDKFKNWLKEINLYEFEIKINE